MKRVLEDLLKPSMAQVIDANGLKGGEATAGFDQVAVTLLHRDS